MRLQGMTVTGGFWKEKQDLISKVVIPYQEKILNDEVPGAAKSHAFANFRIAAGMEEGEFYGMVFQDSDVAKWLEGVAYALADHADPELEERADAIIDIIERAQQPDGYLNTYFTIKEPEHRWQNLQECHELYCAGHMMEAAVAYYEATGKDKLLRVMEKMADLIDDRFGVGHEEGIPGHEEVEIGLLRLSAATGKARYRILAKHLIDLRGTDPDIFRKEKEKRGWVHWGMDTEDHNYAQIQAPVRQQTKAVGHSVRAVYLYTAMADLAKQTNDTELREACCRLWENITQHRMYVTGGIGQTAKYEGFTVDDDLPNDTIYAETCASIGLIFFARKMLDLYANAEYADVMERALYNGVLAGMSADGKHFFYVNPLESNPGISGTATGYEHVKATRPAWYGCACCPPNIVRLVMSLPQYAWGEGAGTVFNHLFLSGSFEGSLLKVQMSSNYPWEGDVTWKITPTAPDTARTRFAIRLPYYMRADYQLTINDEQIPYCAEEARIELPKVIYEVRDGYLYLEREWHEGDTVRLTFKMAVRKVYNHTRVRQNVDSVALMRGPLVYCIEGADNGADLQELRLLRDGEITAETIGEGKLAGMVGLRAKGVRIHSKGEALYAEEAPVHSDADINAIPYFAWDNRGENQMKVWIPQY